MVAGDRFYGGAVRGKVLEAPAGMVLGEGRGEVAGTGKPNLRGD